MKGGGVTRTQNIVFFHNKKYKKRNILTGVCDSLAGRELLC